MSDKIKIGFIACTALGLLLVVMAVAVGPIMNNYLSSKVPSYVALRSPSSPLFSTWRGDPARVTRTVSYYFYNITNGMHVRDFAAIPAVQLVGPFTFIETREKVNVTWSPDGSRILYNVNHAFTLHPTRCPPFNPKTAAFHWGDDDSSTSSASSSSSSSAPLCTLPLDTPIATANIPLLSILQQCLDLGWLEDELVNKFIDHVNQVVGSEDLFPVLPAGKLIRGYNDTIDTKINELVSFFNSIFNTSLDPQDSFYALQRSPAHESELFSSVASGAGDIAAVNRFASWLGAESLPGVWNETCAGVAPATAASFDKQANMINGSDGSMFQPLVDGDRAIFMEEILRSVVLTKTGSASVRGVPVSQYSIANTALVNASTYQPNCAFAANGASGLLNMSGPFNAPLYFSYPVFDKADTSLLKNVTGLASLVPATSSFAIDSWTGLCFSSRRRWQVNTHVQPSIKLRLLRWVREGGFYLPAAVIDQRMDVTQETAESWQQEIGNYLDSSNAARLSGIVSGAFFLAAALSMLIVMVSRCRRPPRDEKVPLLRHVSITS